MKYSRTTALALLAVLSLIAPALAEQGTTGLPAAKIRSEYPVPGVDYGYGSGAIANWSTMSRALSTATQWNNAPVWQFGDSIARADGPDFAQRLYDTTSMTLAVDNWNGRPTDPAVDSLESMLALYEAPEYLVMATGTNDIFRPPVVADQIARVMAAVPESTQVIWVNTYAQRWSLSTTVQLADVRNSGWVNLQIAAADTLYDNLTVVRWYEFLSSYPSYRISNYLSDGVHTSTLGRGARNQLIVNTIASLV